MLDTVYTVYTYYDGPRAGIADFRGEPHVYASYWSDVYYKSEDAFLLAPIARSTLELALEDWEIWRRWEIAFHEGRASQSTHPALPEDQLRHTELELELRERLKVDGKLAFCARARFEVQPVPPGYVGGRPLLVEWTVIPCDDATDHRDKVDFE